MTTEEDLHTRISALVAREHELREHAQSGETPRDDARAQLRDIEVQLDQCWDLLRQRDALRHNDGDPDQAAVRPATEVEGYLQ